MNKPHVHADLIKKWADGAKIQYLNASHIWIDTVRPSWDSESRYRVKPETFKFRLFQWNCGITTVVAPKEEGTYIQRECDNFGKFISDWVEVDLI